MSFDSKKNYLYLAKQQQLMKTYTYADLTSFEEAMKEPEHLADMAKAVVTAIELANRTKRKVAEVCNVAFDTEDSVESFRVRVPKAEWVNALSSSMKHLEAVGYVDEVIDTYMLRKQLTD
jgi:citrate lyase beta subunit